MKSQVSKMTYYSELKPKEKWNDAHSVSKCVFVIGCVLILGLLVFSYLLSLRHLPMQRSNNMIVSRDEQEIQFTAYMKMFGKKYKDKEEYFQRFNNFKESISDIEMLRRTYHGFAKIAKYGFTKFSDMSKEEFKNTMLMDAKYLGHYGTNGYDNDCLNKKKYTPKLNGQREWEGAIPLEFDWRKQNVVGQVLDQGECGSCWAHCTVGIMESMVRMSNLTRRHQYSELSIQELLDCSTYTEGCKGGSPKYALEYLCDEHLPIVPVDVYPLKNRNGDCKYKVHPKHGVVASKIMLRYDMPQLDIAATVARHGPVMATVNALSWINYLGGVIQYDCSGLHLNHVVQIVGYNMMDPELPYFIVRNSFGTDWGDHGYVYLSMAGVCGIGRQIGFLNVTIV